MKVAGGGGSGAISSFACATRSTVSRRNSIEIWTLKGEQKERERE